MKELLSKYFSNMVYGSKFLPLLIFMYLLYNTAKLVESIIGLFTLGLYNTNTMSFKMIAAIVKYRYRH